MGNFFRCSGKTNSYESAFSLAIEMANKDLSYTYKVGCDKTAPRWRYWVEKRLSSNQQIMLWEYAR